MNHWQKEELNEQYADCASPAYNKFSGYLDYDLAEELDLLTEKLTPLVVDEFLETQSGFDALIECLKRNPNHRDKFENLGYGDGVEREDLLTDVALKNFIAAEIQPIAEKVARYRIRTA